MLDHAERIELLEHVTEYIITSPNKSFEAYLKEIQDFDDYMYFLMNEANISLPQFQPEKPSWGTVVRGFKEVGNDPALAAELVRSGNKGPRGSVQRRKMLGKGASNPKIEKEGEAVPEYSTALFSGAPSTESGVLNTCVCSTKGCEEGCLNKAGRGAATSTQRARIAKTQFMASDPRTFIAKLDAEIKGHARSAKRKGQRPAARLNTFTDIPWETYAPHVIKGNPDVQFYDYTKIAGRLLGPRTKNADGSTTRKRRALPANYHLTFSSTGIEGPDNNWADARDLLSQGGDVAMVFDSPSGKGKPGGKGFVQAGKLPAYVKDEQTGQTFRVINADTHDHRHLSRIEHGIPEGEGIIHGLTFKGGRRKRAAARQAGFAVPLPAEGDTVVVPTGVHDATRIKKRRKSS